MCSKVPPEHMLHTAAHGSSDSTSCHQPRHTGRPFPNSSGDLFRVDPKMYWFSFILLFATAGVLRADDQTTKQVNDRLVPLRDTLVDLLGDLKAYSWMMLGKGDVEPIPYVENLLRIIQFVINDVFNVGLLPVDVDLLVVRKLRTSDDLTCVAKVTWSRGSGELPIDGIFTNTPGATAPTWHGKVQGAFGYGIKLLGLTSEEMLAEENVEPIVDLLAYTEGRLRSLIGDVCDVAGIIAPTEQFLTDFGKLQEHILMVSMNPKTENAKTPDFSRPEPDARSVREEEDGHLRLQILRRCLDLETSDEKRDCLKNGATL